jgi:PIN domain nuclease of toxin-antitoxin system
VRVLLDTQIVYLAAGAVPSEGRIPSKILKLLADSETERLISVASIMEIAIKNTRGTLILSEANLFQAISDLCLTVIPFNATHAFRLFSLPNHHRDPFDRMIIATALAEDIPLMGPDRMFKKYRGLKVTW